MILYIDPLTLNVKSLIDMFMNNICLESFSIIFHKHLESIISMKQPVLLYDYEISAILIGRELWNKSPYWLCNDGKEYWPVKYNVILTAFVKWGTFLRLFWIFVTLFYCFMYFLARKHLFRWLVLIVKSCALYLLYN